MHVVISTSKETIGLSPTSPWGALSQAARQGLAVLMASAVVVLKHETSTFRQRHNIISIDFKFDVGDYVREVTNPDEITSGPMSGRDATWGNIDGTVVFYILQKS